jgi:hypothetical protein
MAKAPQTSVEHPGPAGGMPAAREIVELWIRLSRSDWTSVILVPTDPDGSTAAIARALADVGQRLSFFQVTAIAVNSFEYGSALALADLQQQVDRDRHSRPYAEQVGPPPAPPVEVGGGAPAPTEVAPDAPPPGSEALMVSPPARLIISIPPVISEPLGLNATHGADAVILSIQLGRTQLGDVRRTVELIGRERVAGCILGV